MRRVLDLRKGYKDGTESSLYLTPSFPIINVLCYHSAFEATLIHYY